MTRSTPSGEPVWRYAYHDGDLYRCQRHLWPKAVWSDAEGWVTFPIEYEYEGEPRLGWPSEQEINGLREVEPAEAWRIICAWRDGVEIRPRYLERRYYDPEPDDYEAELGEPAAPIYERPIDAVDFLSNKVTAAYEDGLPLDLGRHGTFDPATDFTIDWGD